MGNALEIAIQAAAAWRRGDREAGAAADERLGALLRSITGRKEPTATDDDTVAPPPLTDDLGDPDMERSA